jgi:hypothetical protein
VVLPRPEDVARFRREVILDRLDQFLGGASPAGLTERTEARLRAAIPMFDTNHDGILQPEERAAMLRFLATRLGEPARKE